MSPTDKPTLYQAEVYARADDDDTMRGDWEDILALCERPFAEAYLALNLWHEHNGEPAPSLETVLHDAMHTDYLVFASESDKDQMVQWLIANDKLKPTEG